MWEEEIGDIIEDDTALYMTRLNIFLRFNHQEDSKDHLYCVPHSKIGMKIMLQDILFRAQFRKKSPWKFTRLSLGHMFFPDLIREIKD